jgi:hypothetical protein
MQMGYESWKAAMQAALTAASKYEAHQIGQRIHIDRMAALADEYPEHEARFDAEVEAA